MTAVVWDAYWNNPVNYSTAQLSIDLTQSPQVVTLRLSSAAQVQELNAAGLTVTLVRGDGSSWDSWGIKPPYFANPVTITQAGTGCSDNECLFFVGANFDPNMTLVVRDSNWNNPVTYPTSQLVFNLTANPEVITVRLNAPEVAELFSSGVVITLVRGDGSSWANWSIPPP
jgi:hypothetical protein